VFAGLEGAQGNTGPLRLLTGYVREKKDKQLFHAGCSDIFYCVGKDVGELKAITLLSETGQWTVEFVLIRTCTTLYTCNFANVPIKPQGVTMQLEKRADFRRPLSTGGSIVLGPILRCLGVIDGAWCLSALVLTLDASNPPGPMVLGDKQMSSNLPVFLYGSHNCQLWRYDFAVPLVDTGYSFPYITPDGEKYSFVVPGRGEAPRMLLGSCNDLVYPYRLKTVTEKNVMWDFMRDSCLENPFHAMILAGDQVYCDFVFGCSTAMQDYQYMTDPDTQLAVPFSAQMKADADCFYFKIYAVCWSQGSMPWVMARIPSIMVWDDHEIFNGWGSLYPRKQMSRVYQGLFQSAKFFYFLFQHHGDLTGNVMPQPSPDGPYHYARYLTGNVLVLVPDERSERRMLTDTESGIVMNEPSWQAIEGWLRNTATSRTATSRLMLVSSAPVVYAHSDTADRLMEKLNIALIEDSWDHWVAGIHKQELNRLLTAVGNFVHTTKCRMTFLSGDVHVAGCGIITDGSNEFVADHLISSGIAADPPSRISLWLLFNFLHRHFKVGQFSLSVHRMPHKRYYYDAPNYLILEPMGNNVDYQAIWVCKPKTLRTMFGGAAKPKIISKAMH
jgi:hypothetical protein